jgi:hypothetical protein
LHHVCSARPSSAIAHREVSAWQPAMGAGFRERP